MMTMEQPELNSLMESPSEQLEIENNRYLRHAFWCLPLHTGRIAILTPRRDFFCIVENWKEACIKGPGAEAAQKAPRLFAEPLLKSSINLDLDLDL